MEIEQVRKLKAELEDIVLDLLVKFEQATDIAITDIDLHLWYFSEMGAKRQSKVNEVNIRCEV